MFRTWKKKAKGEPLSKIAFQFKKVEIEKKSMSTRNALMEIKYFNCFEDDL